MNAKRFEQVMRHARGEIIPHKVVKPPSIPKPKKEKLKLTRAKFDKLCRDTRKDVQADMPDLCLEDAAYDLADCLLNDPDVLAFCEHTFNTRNRQLLKEVVADNTHG